MVSVPASRVVDHVFQAPSWVKPKSYKIDMCCFSAEHIALRSKSKACWAQDQGIVSKWSNIYTHGLLCQLASTIKIQLSELV
jgi:hypothetical protein